MKKIKIMLISLALFAIVGGALAFKAKFHDSFCTADAYFNGVGVYYCSFRLVGLPTTTKLCVRELPNLTTDESGVKKVCTTTPDAGVGCNTICPIQCSIINN